MNGKRRRLVGPAVHLCFSDMLSGPRSKCPGELHDYPLPAGYPDASEAAERRLANGWESERCPACGLCGWRPGTPIGEPCDERVPAQALSDHEEDGSA